MAGQQTLMMFGLTVADHLNVLFPFPAWDAKTALASADKLTKLEMMQRAIRKASQAAG